MSSLSLESTINSLNRLTEQFSSLAPFESLREQARRLRFPGFEWPSLRIGRLKAQVPVVQGGMGLGISLSGLAAAVANAGGIGVIAANAVGMIEKDYYADGRAANLRAFRREIRTARERTDGLLGANIMVAMEDFHDLLDVAIEEQIDLVIMGAGLPVKGIPVQRMRENGVHAAPIVSSVRAAELIFKMWKRAYGDVPDAVVFEGPLAGGHIGFSVDQIDDPAFQLEAIVPGVVECLKPYEEEFGRTIPVIAGGGVFTGEDVHSVLNLGAAGVQMGTRFVATDECDAAVEFKQAFVDCTEDQIGIIQSPVGMPGRAIRNEFIKNSEARESRSFRCAWKCLASCEADKAKYCISIALNNARKGKVDKGFVFCGSNAHRVEQIVPVSALVGELAEGYRVAAREAISRVLPGLVARVQQLIKEHEGIGARAKEAGLAYERALSEGFQAVKASGLQQIRETYEGLQSKASHLQYQIAESLADSWALIRNETSRA